MYNLLPPKEQKATILEYRLRVLSLSLVAVSLILLFMSILTIPSYYAVAQKKVFLQSQYDTIHKSMLSKTDPSVAKSLRAAKDKMTLVQPFLLVNAPSTVVTKVLAYRTSGIVLTSFRTEPDAQHVRQVTLYGRASDRQTLLDFSKRLEREKAFSAVVLPVSNFQKSTNIDFTIQLKATI